MMTTLEKLICDLSNFTSLNENKIIKMYFIFYSVKLVNSLYHKDFYFQIILKKA